MKRFKLHTINSLFKYSLKRRYTSFLRCLSDSRNHQYNYLRTLLEANSATIYGKRHHFNGIQTIRDYTSNVPLVTYDDLGTEIEQILNGRPNVLIREPVIMFEKTSGSTSASKYIPFSQSLLNEIHNATSAWIYNIYDRFQGLSKTTAYWSISPKLGAQEFTPAGIKVGFADDSDYFAPLERKFLKHILAVNPALSKLDAVTFRKESALSLIRDENLGLISVWNPSLFVLVLEYIEKHREALLSDLGKKTRHVPPKRFKRIAALLTKQDTIDFQALWPRLQFISCWTDGASSLFLPALQRYFPDIRIQGKGLFMTEGIVTIPIIDRIAPILCVNAHFYEFIECRDEEAIDFNRQPPTLLPHELQHGKEYIPVITNGAGLYRYVTGDRVRVQGFFESVPLLQFLGRCNNIVDLCGEKLNEAFVAKVMVQLNQKYGLDPEFAMLAPALDAPPHYIYFVEQPRLTIHPSELAKTFDGLLCENHHYNLCRGLGQLGPVEAIRIEQGRRTYVETMADRKHQKQGNIKNKILDSNLFWKDHFTAILTKEVYNRTPSLAEEGYPKDIRT